MKRTTLLLLQFMIYMSLYGQKIEKKIDRIFSDWDQNNYPGGVIIITNDKEVVFSKAYGLANIQYNAPNTIESLFNIGSVSKQFTALGIISLHLDGQLNIDDDVRKYIPELYDFEHQITIRHLLHHTSGLRSTPEFFGLIGWRDGDAIYTEDDFRFLCKQKSLNFEPGSQFMYSNSGYILLAKIIERISGKDYNSWMKENIFQPLGLSNTYVNETNNNSLPLVSTPYMEVAPEQFTTVENSSQDIGASNIYTNATDLSKWMSNFNDPAKGWEKAFQMLLTTDSLNNGEPNNYAFGIFLDDFFGNSRIQHSGGVSGFISHAMYFPEEKISIVLLSNALSRSANEKMVMIQQLFLDNKTSTKKKINAPLVEKTNLENAKDHLGDYWNKEGNYPRSIYIVNDTLWYMRNNGMKSPLLQIGDNQFIIGGINDIVKVSFEPKNLMMVRDEDNPVQIFERYDANPITNEAKMDYVGSFYSDELETTYTISLEDGELMGYHTKHGYFPIQILKSDVIDWSGFAIAEYIRNDKKEVIGFLVSINRAKNIFFRKLPD